MAKDKNR